MSELLEEAKKRLEIEQEEFIMNEPGYEDTDNYQKGLNDAWQEAVTLIEKHEKPQGLLDVVGKWPTFEEGLEIALLKNENARLKSEPVLTEKQERAYEKIKSEYASNQECFPGHKDNIAYALGCAVAGINDDTAFIPALRKFLNEVAE